VTVRARQGLPLIAIVLGWLLAVLVGVERRSLCRRLADARREAGTDPLTGLANRAGLDHAAARVLASAGRTGRHVLVVVIDLDDFKPVNDRYGHGAGDLVLTLTGTRLRNLFGAGAVIARLGGDEFAVLGLLPTASDPNQAAAAVRVTVSAALARPIRYGERVLTVTASVGVLIAPPVRRPPLAGLLAAADHDMYQAKHAAKQVKHAATVVA
jgi:diguanylate cyclase (GGDEF)-like protein